MAIWKVKIGLFERDEHVVQIADNATPAQVATILIENELIDKSEIMGQVYLSPDKDGNVTLTDDSGYPYAKLSKVQEEATLGEVSRQAVTQTNNIPKCLTCGSTNIRKIGISTRAVAGTLFGVVSKTARSQFQCKNCGYKW